MFRQLATWFDTKGPAGTGTDQVFALHPMELTRFLEEAWSMRSDFVAKPSPAIPVRLYPVEATSGLDTDLNGIAGSIYPTNLSPAPGPKGTRVMFRHLIYAYLIENTRAFEIFRRVLEDCAYGERLDTPGPQAQAWLRTTEALFYSDTSPGHVYSVTSSIRPDARGMRRNVYYRLFGMDLNHGLDDGQPYPYVRAVAANREFVPLFEDFMREVWRGIENWTNTSGPKGTDDAAIAELGAALADVLTVRRRNGAISREEFSAVAAMSWMHLTLMTNTAIVRDLNAEATSPEERLRKLGERVGLAPHPKSEQYFAMADAISNILIGIESRLFSNPASVAPLYAAPPPANPVRDDMMAIIAQWSIATGRDMKARKVVTTERTMPRRPMSAPPRRPELAQDGRPRELA